MGTPSFSNCSRVATPPLPSVDSNEAARSRVRCRGPSRRRARCRRGGAPSRSPSPGPCSTGSVQVAVPAMRSARPRESRISVDALVEGDGALRGGVDRDLLSAVVERDRVAGGARACRRRRTPAESESRRRRRSAGRVPAVSRTAAYGRDVRAARESLGVEGSCAKPGRTVLPLAGRTPGLPAGLRTRGRPDGAPSRSPVAPSSGRMPRPSPSPLRVSSGFAPDSLTPRGVGSTGVGKLSQAACPPPPTARRRPAIHGPQAPVLPSPPARPSVHPAPSRPRQSMTAVASISTRCSGMSRAATPRRVAGGAAVTPSFAAARRCPP